MLVLYGCTAISTILAAYFTYAQYTESRVIASYIDSNKLRVDTLGREHILQVVDRIRADFNSDEASFKHLNMNARPFLREDTRTLLNYREGLCGEGTRVIVNLLNKLGYDATRITLYDKRLQSAHTLVSVKVNGHEFLVDSINSREWVHILLDSELIAPSHFDILHYTDDHEARTQFELSAKEGIWDQPIDRFFRTYRLYSYEAIPFTKLLTTIGWDVRIFNFQRPGQLPSRLAEAPNLIYMLVWASIGIACITLSLLLRRNTKHRFN